MMNTKDEKEVCEELKKPSSNMAMDVSRMKCPSQHSWKNRAVRMLWAGVWVLFFRPTPRCMRAWRRGVLRCFGAQIGKGVKVMPSARIWFPANLIMEEESSLGDYVDCYCVDTIQIGAHASVSQHATLCAATHDIEDPHMRLKTAPIYIEDQAWVCASAFIFPGIKIGQGAVVGAGSIVTKDVAPWRVAAGNPAKEIKKRVLRDAPDR